MQPAEAGEYVRSLVTVTREDIARAKGWLTRADGGSALELSNRWLSEQGIVEQRKVDTDADDCADLLAKAATTFGIRLAFFQAVWELVAAGELIPTTSPGRWRASLEYKTSHYAGAIPLGELGCAIPERIERPPFVPVPTVDPDIFLKGIDCAKLHSGIFEAVEQSLNCFRRGLYMPATAMLAAAAEATWIECGVAVATKLSNTKLESIVKNQYDSISKKVTEVRKALEHSNAKSLLKAAGQSIPRVVDVEVWTTALRERRNALHWGKAKSFIVDHSDAGTLLMAAPQHLGTLESIRVAC